MNLKQRLGKLKKKHSKLFLVLGLISLTLILGLAVLLTNSTARNLIINSEAAGSTPVCDVFTTCGNFNDKKAECDQLIKKDDDLLDELVKLRQIRNPNNRQKARIRVLDKELSAHATAQVYVNCSNYYDNTLLDCMKYCEEINKIIDDDKPKRNGGRTGGSGSGRRFFPNLHYIL